MAWVGFRTGLLHGPGMGPAAPGSAVMTHRRNDHEREERRRFWRRTLSPDERALREARRRANRKVAFLFHRLAYASVEVFLLFVAGFRAALVVGIGWGVGLTFHYFAALVAPGLPPPPAAPRGGRGLVGGMGGGIGLTFHYFAALVAPGLRRRLIDQEVSRELEASAPAERRHLEDRHARTLERLPPRGA